MINSTTSGRVLGESEEVFQARGEEQSEAAVSPTMSTATRVREGALSTSSDREIVDI